MLGERIQYRARQDPLVGRSFSESFPESKKNPLRRNITHYFSTDGGRGSEPQNFSLPEKPLTDNQIARIIAAAGNNESKGVVLMAMDTGKTYSDRGLHAAYIEAQGRQPGRKLAIGTVRDYCIRSFIPMGLVEGHFQLTKLGREIGVPLTALLLDFSRRHPDFVLNDFFSATNTKKPKRDTHEGIMVRPATRRIKLFRVLVDAKREMKVAELARAIEEEDMTTLNHVRTLGLSKIISLKKDPSRNDLLISVDPEQKKILLDLLRIIDGVQNKNPEILQEGRKLAEEFRTKTEDVAILMKKTAEHSARKKTELLKDHLPAMIQASETYVSSSQLQEVIKETFGLAINIKTLENHLKELAESGVINESENQKGYFYTKNTL